VALTTVPDSRITRVLVETSNNVETGISNINSNKEGTGSMFIEDVGDRGSVSSITNQALVIKITTVEDMRVDHVHEIVMIEEVTVEKMMTQ
jgi:hypothetical protein